MKLFSNYGITILIKPELAAAMAAAAAAMAAGHCHQQQQHSC
jgi:hypothetical protein